MHKIAIVRDAEDLQAVKQFSPTLVFSVPEHKLEGAIPFGFRTTKIHDVSLLALAGAMSIVGRVEMTHLFLPKQKNRDVEILFKQVVYYFSQKCKKPHTIDVSYYGDYVATEPEKEVYDRPIVLMGGGTDSVGIYLHYLLKGHQPIGIHFEYGQFARTYEKEALTALAAHFKSDMLFPSIKTNRLRRELNKYARSGTEGNVSTEGAFPARNWIFYLTTLSELSRLHGNEIAVSVFQGEFDDNHPDHSPRTLQDFQDIIDAYIGKGKCKVVVPMRELSKSDSVFWYKQKIEQLWPIDKTRSCYGMFRRIDGCCVGCLNKFVAMAFAGYDMSASQFKDCRVQPTYTTKYFHKYFKRALEGSMYPESRNAEIMWTMHNHPPTKKQFQTELQLLLETHAPRVKFLLEHADYLLKQRDADVVERSMEAARHAKLI